MSQRFSNLTPLKEEYYSEDEDDGVEDKRPVSFLKGRRMSIKNTIKTSDLNLNLSLYDLDSNNILSSSKSPKKTRNSLRLLSQKLMLNKPTSSKVDMCLYALEIQPSKRNPETINHIKSYLKSMPSFMNIISKEQNSSLSENLIEEISIHLRHEYIPKNNLVCRFGEKGEKFYIILKGKVTFLVPKMMKCYLNLEEYIIYLMQLRKNEEFELINNLLVQNRIFYPIEDDNLDEYLIKEFDEYQKYVHRTGRKKVKSKTGKNNLKLNFNMKAINDEQNTEKDNSKALEYELDTNLKLDLKSEERPDVKRLTIGSSKYINTLNVSNNSQKRNYFSYQTYQKMGSLVSKINQSRAYSLSIETSTNNLVSGENSVKAYLRANNVQDRELESYGRKLVNIYHYEEMSTFENGQTFGFIALQSKASKRASTAVVVEDCDLGVLNKDEYLQFFEVINTKEKKNLYELLKFYNLITAVSEHKFIKRFYHMFEYKKFYKNNIVLDINKPFKELLVFSSGLFIIYIKVNIPELNDLITKIKTMRGKLLGLSKYKIERSLEEKRENQDLMIRRNYMSEKESKILLKKYNYTISIISDHLILGYPDTIDPLTHLPLFNCVCTSAESDGYSISNKSIKLINQDSVVIHNLKEFCLMKMDYNLQRLKQFKKEILSKMKANEIATFSENNENQINEENMNDNDENIKENDNNIYDGIADLKRNNFSSEKFNYINRNELNMFKNMDNNKKKLLTNELNQEKIEKAINIIQSSKNEEKKNILEKSSKRSYINTISRNNKLSNIKPFNTELNNQKEKMKESTTIIKLRESILNKQKKIELKLEENNIQMNDKKYKSVDNYNFKHSLSTETFNKNMGRENDINNNKNKSLSKSLKKMRFNSINLFKNYADDIDKIKSYNNKLLTPLLTKSGIESLPSIKNKNKKFKNFFKEGNLNIKTENEIQKRAEKNINEDLYKIEQLSFVKEKFIIFKSKKKIKPEVFNTVNFDLLPKINKNKQNEPIKIKTQFFKGLSNVINIDSNKFNYIKDNDDKKNNYINSLSSKLSLKQKNIKDKYNELNILVNNMHNITKEILTKKDINNKI